MAIVRKDKLLAGYNGNLESVKILNDVANENSGVEVTNGVFVTLDGFLAGQRETRKAKLAVTADSSAGKEILLVHNAEVMYDERKNKLADFRIAANKVARAYRLFDGDIVTLTADLFNGTPAVNDVLIPTVGGKLGAIGATTGAKVKFQVIEDCGFELDTQMKAFAVQVIR